MIRCGVLLTLHSTAAAAAAATTTGLLPTSLSLIGGSPHGVYQRHHHDGGVGAPAPLISSHLLASFSCSAYVAAAKLYEQQLIRSSLTLIGLYVHGALIN